jgi:hypothetical protein
MDGGERRSRPQSVVLCVFDRWQGVYGAEVSILFPYPSISIRDFLLTGLLYFSLATVEMKILLKEVYSHFRTTLAEDMTGCMDIDDQIISSRPMDQTCKLEFSKR